MEMTTTTVTAAEVFKNWSAMYDQFSAADESLDGRFVCAHCGTDEVHERFGSDYVCERCATLIGNVLTTIHYGLEPAEDGLISVVP